MKIQKTANIKQAIVEYLKSVYTEGYEVDAGHYYTSIRMKDVGSVELQFLNRRHIRVKGMDGEQAIGGGVSFNGRRNGAMIIHGGAKSEFGIFDEVELKRRIDHRFKAKIDQKLENEKQANLFKDRCASLDPILVSYGFQANGGNSYSWQKTWTYNKQVGVVVRNGSATSLELYNNNITEEQVLKLAKVIQETLSE